MPVHCDCSLSSNVCIISEVTIVDGSFSTAKGKIRRQSDLIESTCRGNLYKSNRTMRWSLIFETWKAFHGSRREIWKFWKVLGSTFLVTLKHISYNNCYKASNFRGINLLVEMRFLLRRLDYFKGLKVLRSLSWAFSALYPKTDCTLT